jgi:hypothetical protein
LLIQQFILKINLTTIDAVEIRMKTAYKKLKVEVEVVKETKAGEFKLPKVGESVKPACDIKGILRIFQNAVEAGKEEWESKLGRKTSFDDLLAQYVFLSLLNKLGVRNYPENERRLSQMPKEVEYLTTNEDRKFLNTVLDIQRRKATDLT